MSLHQFVTPRTHKPRTWKAKSSSHVEVEKLMDQVKSVHVFVRVCVSVLRVRLFIFIHADLHADTRAG